MFRSRNDGEKGTAGGRNKDVNIPLVRDRDSDEAAAIKVRETKKSRLFCVCMIGARLVAFWQHIEQNVCSDRTLKHTARFVVF